MSQQTSPAWIVPSRGGELIFPSYGSATVNINRKTPFFRVSVAAGSPLLLVNPANILNSTPRSLELLVDPAGTYEIPAGRTAKIFFLVRQTLGGSTGRFNVYRTPDPDSITGGTLVFDSSKSTFGANEVTTVYLEDIAENQYITFVRVNNDGNFRILHGLIIEEEA